MSVIGLVTDIDDFDPTVKVRNITALESHSNIEYADGAGIIGHSWLSSDLYDLACCTQVAVLFLPPHELF